MRGSSRAGIEPGKRRVDALTKSSAEWEERAARAVRSGDDNLAKEALGRKADIDGELAIANTALLEAGVYVTNIKSSLEQLEKRVLEVKASRTQIKEKARRAAGKSALSVPGLERFEAASTKSAAVT